MQTCTMPEPLSIAELIAYNLMRIRKTLGLSQEQAAERLEPYLGTRWSKAVYSAAERSYQGKRVRQFTAAELAAFALAFEVSVVYFLLPPRPEDRGAEVVQVGERLLGWRELYDLMLGGRQKRSAFTLRIAEAQPGETPGNLDYLAAMGMGAWTNIKPGPGDDQRGPLTANWQFLGEAPADPE